MADKPTVPVRTWGQVPDPEKCARPAVLGDSVPGDPVDKCGGAPCKLPWIEEAFPFHGPWASVRNPVTGEWGPREVSPTGKYTYPQNMESTCGADESTVNFRRWLPKSPSLILESVLIAAVGGIMVGLLIWRLW